MASAAATSSLNSLHQKLFHPSSSYAFPQKPSLSLSSISSPLSPPSLSLSTTTAFSLLTPTTTPSTTSPPSFDALAHHLSVSDFRNADEETRRLIIALAGEPAIKRGYVFFSEVQFIDPSDLQQIDTLWRQHSDGRFGYSVQKKIWEKKAGKDFTGFFIKVGWMKKLETEVEQWNYKSFPDEFIWELNDETPVGHLPLTNALRGTQLLQNILTHPAFDDDDDQEEASEEEKETDDRGGEKREKVKFVRGNMGFKTDYSF